MASGRHAAVAEGRPKLLLLVCPCVGKVSRPVRYVAAYLCLDPVEASEPEDLAPAQLALGVVDLLFPLGQLLIGHLILAWPVARLLQALELAGGDGGNDLREPPLRDSKQR